MSENHRMIVHRGGESRPTRIPLPPDYQIKAGTEDTEGRFSFLEVAVTHDIPRHIHHTDDEAFYLLEGELEVEFEGEKYSVTPGMFMLLPHGVPHQVKVVSQTPPRLLQVSSPGGFEHFLEDLIEVQSDGDPEKFAAVSAKHRWSILP